MADVEKEIKKEEKVISKFFSKRENVWMTVSIVLAILLVVSLVWSSGISKNAAGKKLVDFLNNEVVQGGGVTLKSVTSNGTLYTVNVLYQGKEIPLQMTSDGKYFIQGATEITSVKASSSTNTNSNTQTSVPKSDKPKVDLYVFSYCPYGTQTEKGFIPVYNLLKNKADMNIVFIGAMHGEFEKTESLRQLCIQKNYGKDKMMSYISKFVVNSAIGNCNGDDACLKPLLATIYSSLAIDANTVNTCMANDAATLYAADESQAQSLGISGSPTLVVNGVETQSGRSPSELLKTVCSAFNNAPSECSQTLDSASPSPGFGSSTSSGSSSGTQCG